MSFSSKQLEDLLDRRVQWAGSSRSFDEYIIGRSRTLRVRVRGDRITDVMDHLLTVEQIKAETGGNQYDRGSDQSIAATDSDTAKDVLRKQRVEAVLAVYGTPEEYFLCHPNGGVPRADFSWYKSMGVMDHISGV